MKKLEEYKLGDKIYFLINEQRFFLCKGVIEIIEIQKSITQKIGTDTIFSNDSYYIGGQFYNHKGKRENFSLCSNDSYVIFSDTPENLINSIPCSKDFVLTILDIKKMEEK